MEILTPIKDLAYLPELISAGANEFYLGFFDKNWNRKFGFISDLNKMSLLGVYANLDGIEIAASAIEKIVSFNKKAFLTLNAHTYSSEQLSYIEKNYIPVLKKTKVSGVISSNYELIKLLLRNDIQPVMSTLAGIYNQDILKAFLLLGVKRVIIPRDLQFSEIKSIVDAFPEIEFETFLMRNRCKFSESSCLSTHAISDIGGICNFSAKTSKKNIFFSDKSNLSNFNINDNLYSDLFFHKEACALCSLFDFKTIGIKSVKIVGRPDSCAETVYYVKLIQKNLDIVNKSKTKQEYLQAMILPDKFPYRCSKGLGCYYPESRFN